MDEHKGSGLVDAGWIWNAGDCLLTVRPSHPTDPLRFTWMFHRHTAGTLHVGHAHTARRARWAVLQRAADYGVDISSAPKGGAR